MPGYENAILNEYTSLPLKCADGLDTMIDMLAEREPGLGDRCGLIANRHELYAIPLVDCTQRRLIVTIDCRDEDRPRVLHGTLPNGKHTYSHGARVAIQQLGLVNPAWEPAS